MRGGVANRAPCASAWVFVSAFAQMPARLRLGLGSAKPQPDEQVVEGRAGRWLATAATAGLPLAFLIWQPADPQGRPAWLIFWSLFGASNQLLAALTLLGVTVWLWRTYRAGWVLVVTGLPCLWMYVMSMWALVRILWPLGAAITAAVQ